MVALIKGRRYLKMFAFCILIAVCYVIFLDNKWIQRVIFSRYYTNDVTSNQSVAQNMRTKGYRITLDDIFISVKTTKQFHKSRVSVIIDTWFQFARNQTWFFTDGNDREFEQKTNNHMINTKCPPTHSRYDLMCKMQNEINSYFNSEKMWFCHFDDDNYVNIPRLVELLGNYDPKRDWYLGRISIPARFYDKKLKKTVTIGFGTGGGFCFSRGLATKMIPVVGGDKLISISNRTGTADDITIGYAIIGLIGVPLTEINLFHTSMEILKALNKNTLHEQITLSYKHFANKKPNIVDIEGFNMTYDPTRFLSLHCSFFPNVSFCSENRITARSSHSSANAEKS